VFLSGGPAFSGTTLLALLLNQDGLVCLDEPDFHDPDQSHRGIPFLRELFPGAALPPPPGRRLTYEEATDLIEQCERAIRPCELGIKTCDTYFLEYAEAYERRGYPVICIVRDIRDAMTSPLPVWLTEEQLNQRYRMIWERAKTMDLWFRYEDLVTDTERVMTRVSRVLEQPLRSPDRWSADQVPSHMLKLDRHELLRAGRISKAGSASGGQPGDRSARKRTRRRG
jgi:hypothetical protein